MELRPAAGKLRQHWEDHQLEEAKITSLSKNILPFMVCFQQRWMAQSCDCALTRTIQLTLANYGQTPV
jgi:hypothetical protein